MYDSVIDLYTKRAVTLNGTKVGDHYERTEEPSELGEHPKVF
jgi:hypothetical protein